MRLLYKLRSQFDEPFRIRHGFGLSPVRSTCELEALIDFCRGQLQEEYIIKYNPTKHDVLIETVRLYDTNGTELYDYINNHVPYYWS